MSFIYGGVNSNSLAGVTATLTAWPSLGGLGLETLDKETVDGRFYGGSGQTHTQLVYDVLIEGETPQEVLQRQRAFVGLIDPRRGPRPMVVEFDTDWAYQDVMPSGQIEWERQGWERGLGFRLRADVAFETTGDAPEAREVNPESVSWAAPTAGITYTLSKGNTSTYPTIEFISGVLKTVTIGDFTVIVAATPAGYTNVLDYDRMDFYQRDAAGVRIRSLVPYMSLFDRPQLEYGVATEIGVVGGTTGSRRFYPNARMI